MTLFFLELSIFKRKQKHCKSMIKSAFMTLYTTLSKQNNSSVCQTVLNVRLFHDNLYLCEAELNSITRSILFYTNHPEPYCELYQMIHWKDITQNYFGHDCHEWWTSRLTAFWFKWLIVILEFDSPSPLLNILTDMLWTCLARNSFKISPLVFHEWKKVIWVSDDIYNK